MRVVILAGGLGTRLSEETTLKPKPMVEIGGRPLLWHIMKHYAHHGFREFFVALGYKSEVIKRYFLEYHTMNSNITVNLVHGDVQVHRERCEDWVVHLNDTGINSMTGGRVQRLQPWLADETFMVTYGDGVSDIDIPDLLRFHRQLGRLATVTAVRPPARFGGLIFEDDLVATFTEKPQIGEGWVNGGFMVLEPGVFDYMHGDDTILESHVLERLASDGQLAAYRHNGFWQSMDTLRDKRLLESLWQGGNPPWRVWE
jgi:glucose-1-phosphate cytidylyltransferase